MREVRVDPRRASPERGSGQEKRPQASSPSCSDGDAWPRPSGSFPRTWARRGLPRLDLNVPDSYVARVTSGGSGRQRPPRPPSVASPL